MPRSRRYEMSKKRGISLQAEEEQRPTEGDQRESQCDCDRPRQPIPSRGSDVVEDDKDRVVDAPCDEVPACAMPQADKREHDQDVSDVCLTAAHPDVDVV